MINLLKTTVFCGRYEGDKGLRRAAGFLAYYPIAHLRHARGWAAELAVGLW